MARDRGATMWEASVALIMARATWSGAAGALSRFIELINALEDDTIELRSHEQNRPRD